MFLALRAVWQGVNDVRMKGYSYIWSNLMFVVLSLPIITAPAALAALFRVSHEAQTNPSNADVGLFWDSFKENLWRGLWWGLAHSIFVVINFTNLSTYAETPGIFAMFLRLIWIGAGFIWGGMFLYTWPFYYQMQQPTLLGATRNALVMVLRNPFFTLMILTAIALVSLMSVILVGMWFLLTFSIITAISTSAVLSQLGDYNTNHNIQTE